MNESAELWLPVVGWEGLYEVSNQGRVRSVARQGVQKNGVQRRQYGRVLKVAPNERGGYMRLVLRRDTDPVNVYVHQLVLLAFVGPRPDGAITRHLNGDPTDNRVENLQWGTHCENAADQLRHGTNSRASRTHCKHDHELSGWNVILLAGGTRRQCRTCMNAAQRRYQQRKKLESK